MKKTVTKSKLMAGFQCAKLLYYQVHQPKLARKFTISEQLLFDQGHLVGTEARKRFNDGYLVTSPPWEYDAAAIETAKAMKSYDVVFEGAFLNGPLFVRADILRKSGEGWDLIEVKSSVSVKEDNLLDCAIQYVVLKGVGISIQSIKLMFINKDCVAPDLSNLFHVRDVTAEVKERAAKVKQSAKDFLELLKKTEFPDIKAGPHCQSPYACRFQDACWKELKMPEVSVVNLPALKSEERWALFRAGRTLDDVDVSTLPEITRRAVEVYRGGRPYIDIEKIEKEMTSWKWPLWYLDFETIAFAVPRFDGTHPYEQVPFQFSLHVQSQKGGPTRHEEFLDVSGNDPREALIKKMLSDIGPEGDIVAYYANFEKKVIEDLAKSFPQYSDKLRALLPRFRDPLPLIRETLYYQEFAGSFSIKSVAPALLGSQFSYKDLAVQDGSMAQAAYLKSISGSEDVSRALREYCARDTEVLVGIVNKLFDYSAVTAV